MRLAQINLTGFKSFADPTQLILSSQLTAVLGPNGCGKSNVIDAVRWVLSESSAKYLRGEEMVDVIFNGSVERKAAGQASVELIFENTHGVFSGDYARCNELSVRRIVNREGQSNYYLNGMRCRKKDVTDLFLWTGLVARSYAIIEQGMIVHVINAKPEALRIFLEEAAGISKYKERRRETAQHIQQTRGNLERVEMIRTELERQLETLKQQSEIAQKYQILAKDSTKYQLEVLALSWRDLEKHLQSLENKLQANLLNIQAKEAEKKAYDTALEKKRFAQKTAQFNLDQHRNHFYELSTSIATLRQAIAHEKEKCAQLEKDLNDLDTVYATNQAELARDHKETARLRARSTALYKLSDSIFTAVSAAQDTLYSIKKERSTWQSTWDCCVSKAVQSSQQAHTEKMRLHHLDEKIQSQSSELKRLCALEYDKVHEALCREIHLIEATCEGVEKLCDAKRLALGSVVK